MWAFSEAAVLFLARHPSATKCEDRLVRKYRKAKAIAIAEELCCEYAVNPLGIDTHKPRFSWILQSKQRGNLDGASECVKIPYDASLFPAEQITISLWIKPEDLSGSWREIYRAEAGASPTPHHLFPQAGHP